MKITRVETDLARLPLPRAVALPTSQDPRAAKDVEVVLVRILTDGPHTGVGFTYTLGGGGAAIRSLLDSLVAPILLNENPTLTERLFLRASHELETVGFPGLAARAYAAVDFALWDVKGKAANLPVYQLLGGYRTKLKAIASDTATPALGAKAAAKETRAALDAGAAGVVVEIGTADPDIDADRVRQLREAVPEGAWFEVSANGRYDFSTALWMGRMCEEDFAIDGFSDPLRNDDSQGLSRLLDRLEVAVSVGSLFDRVDDFVRLLETTSVSAVRIDPLRLGGITPARKVAQLAELRHVAVCPVRLPEVGTHLAAGSVLGRVCETVDWFAPLFDGGPKFVDGQLVVADAPGLGVRPNEKYLAHHRV
jgi:L-alanine-DL-glutamate epimerase-like enolase superfamily enzyme